MPHLDVKGDQLVIQILLGSLAGTAIGLLVGSLINAVWLILANGWIGVARLSYGKAFKAVLTAHFVLLMLGMFIGFVFWFMIVLDESSWRVNLAYLFSPANFFYYTLGSVLVHATIFSHILEETDGTPLRFSRASALTLVYLGITSAFAFIVAALTLVILIGNHVKF